MKKIKEFFKGIFNFFKKIYHIYKDPKYHNYIKLGICLIFFIFMVILTRVSFSPRESKSNSNLSIRSYAFTYEIDNNYIYGVNYNNKELFILNGQKYYKDDNIYQIIDNKKKKVNFDLGVLKIDYKMLDNLGIKNKNDTYLIPLDHFVNLFEPDTGLDLSSLMSYNIIVKKENNTYLLDLSNYYKLYNQSHSNLRIDLYNINNINDFSKEYENMEEVK